MRKQWLWIGACAALLSGCDGVASAARAKDSNDVPLKLSGCVVAGEKADSFLLTNVEVDGTTLAPIDGFYRFNTTAGLERYVGRRVEVKGRADLGDVDRGKVRVESSGGRTTTALTSERRTVKVDRAYFGSLGSMPVDTHVPSYKFIVESVRPLQGNCASWYAAP